LPPGPRPSPRSGQGGRAVVRLARPHGRNGCAVGEECERAAADHACGELRRLLPARRRYFSTAIYPPNQTTPIYLAYRRTGCASNSVNLLTIVVVQAGAGGN